MSRITFYGASDDLIEVDGDILGCDEYNGEHATFEVGEHATFEVGEHATFEVCGLRVSVDFLPSGCWGVQVVQIDEGVPVTATSLRLVAPVHGEQPANAVRLEMDVPEGSHVSKVSP